MSHAINLSRAFGMLYEEEVVFLMEVAKQLPEDAVIANFGAGFGTSSLALREVLPNAKITTIDIRREGNPYGGLGNEYNAFNDAGLLDKLPIQVHDDSANYGFNLYKNIGKPVFDFVFVDGDHSKEGLTRDIEAWKPLVKKGGMMAFHDYEKDVWADVAVTVDTMMSDWKVVGHVRTLKVLKNE
jgi:MMP 1-O-methyltransferase